MINLEKFVWHNTLLEESVGICVLRSAEPWGILQYYKEHRPFISQTAPSLSSPILGYWVCSFGHFCNTILGQGYKIKGMHNVNVED